MKQKIKMMKQQPPLSDEEIRSYMDFDRLMANRKLALNKPKFHLLKWIVPTVAVIGVGAGLFFSRVESEKQPVSVVQEENSISATTQPETAPASNDEIAAAPIEKESSEVKETAKRSSTSIRGEDDHQSSEKKPAEDVYVQAEPADGYSSLYSYFNANLVYPSEAVKDSVQGVETVSFVINTEGKPEKITIRQSLGEPFEREARRLIENMPPWKPATLNGKPVPSQMSVPLTFQIQKVNVNR